MPITRFVPALLLAVLLSSLTTPVAAARRGRQETNQAEAAYEDVRRRYDTFEMEHRPRNRFAPIGKIGYAIAGKGARLLGWLKMPYLGAAFALGAGFVLPKEHKRADRTTRTLTIAHALSLGDEQVTPELVALLVKQQIIDPLPLTKPVAKVVEPPPTPTTRYLSPERLRRELLERPRSELKEIDHALRFAIESSNVARMRKHTVALAGQLGVSIETMIGFLGTYYGVRFEKLPPTTLAGDLATQLASGHTPGGRPLGTVYFRNIGVGHEPTAKLLELVPIPLPKLEEMPRWIDRVLGRARKPAITATRLSVEAVRESMKTNGIYEIAVPGISADELRYVFRLIAHHTKHLPSLVRGKREGGNIVELDGDQAGSFALNAPFWRSRLEVEDGRILFHGVQVATGEITAVVPSIIEELRAQKAEIAFGYKVTLPPLSRVHITPETTAKALIDDLRRILPEYPGNQYDNVYDLVLGGARGLDSAADKLAHYFVDNAVRVDAILQRGRNTPLRDAKAAGRRIVELARNRRGSAWIVDALYTAMNERYGSGGW
jgi:hypothetical protein